MAFVKNILWRNFATSVVQQKIYEFTVIGGGLMGAGIAQQGAQSGLKVTLVDLSQNVLDKSFHQIGESIKRVAKSQFKTDAVAGDKFIESSMKNLSVSTSVESSLPTSDLLIEAVVENLDLKKKLFKEWDALAPSKTIFASNTSSLPIGEIAAATKRPDRFAGLHFFNPVPVMKLLEIIRIPETSEETLKTLFSFGKSIKKTTVSAKDTPGFIVNRLLVPYIMEAIRMVEREDATALDVDVAMKLGAGHPMGPIELADYVGLDTCKFIIDGWSKRYPNETLFKSSPLLDKLVQQKKFGRKSGEGFYKY